MKGLRIITVLIVTCGALEAVSFADNDACWVEVSWFCSHTKGDSPWRCLRTHRSEASEGCQRELARRYDALEAVGLELPDEHESLLLDPSWELDTMFEPQSIGSLGDLGSAAGTVSTAGVGLSTVDPLWAACEGDVEEHCDGEARRNRLRWALCLHEARGALAPDCREALQSVFESKHVFLDWSVSADVHQPL